MSAPLSATSLSHLAFEDLAELLEVDAAIAVRVRAPHEAPAKRSADARDQSRNLAVLYLPHCGTSSNECMAPLHLQAAAHVQVSMEKSMPIVARSASFSSSGSSIPSPEVS